MNRQGFRSWGSDLPRATKAAADAADRWSHREGKSRWQDFLCRFPVQSVAKLFERLHVAFFRRVQEFLAISRNMGVASPAASISALSASADCFDFGRPDGLPL